jgi:micrococcal nuclease
MNPKFRSPAIVGITLGIIAALNGCENGDEKLTHTPDLLICGHSQPNTSTKTCIVDGDTLWLDGINLRLKDFDTPESRNKICGSFKEIDLANAATKRLQQLLNSNSWTIETFGIDGTGKRRLATISIDGQDVGDILISEKLARRWPDGHEFWCD